MRRNLRLWLPKGSIIIFLFFCACDQQAQMPGGGTNTGPAMVGDIPATIGAISVPAGYRRIMAGPLSFGAWLRQIPLKRDRTVYLFDGSPKRNQSAQFAVLDISVGHKDLQQCADAVMRLRAEFLYTQKDFADIDFYTSGGTRLNFREWAGGKRVRLSGDRLASYRLPVASARSSVASARSSGASAGSSGAVPQRGAPGYEGSPATTTSSGDGRGCFGAYLETVFSYCGTLSLEKQLIPVKNAAEMQIGDVLIRGGSPGHAMLVVDMAEDSMGHKVFLLAQSYMPAQDIHVVKNPSDRRLSPWYRLDQAGQVIETPEWTFYTGQLRSWPKKN